MNLQKQKQKQEVLEAKMEFVMAKKDEMRTFGSTDSGGGLKPQTLNSNGEPK
ncbi:hypothetical protein MTR_3g433945 [Medicago truncatula]|uniref:Uncharacterized protein n=1 Tax=Medicago truncatula TaxID=3880 RepID=A0A072UUF3_MEDTR|nr:hypothetical protein MTR_3g433945 [Medicago truncatula]